jgi:hypothetical protein
MRWAAAAAVLLAAVTGALLLVGKSGEADNASATAGTVRLAWKDTPLLIRVPELPRDRIVSGRVRNTSLRPVDLDAERIEIFDADGHRLRSTARFLQGFVHGLYPASMHVKGSKFERTRLGKIATVKPGQELPLTLSWRVAPGGSEPVEVRFDGGRLALPR